MHTLEIKDLKVSVEDKIILNEFNLKIKSNETHVIMGPNGTGKSTLLKVIMGDPNYKILTGDILYDGESILDKTIDERARLGIFLSFQSPVAVEGVSNADFLKSAVQERDKKEFKLFQFIKDLESNYEKLDFNKEFIHRGINEGFSGGERKKNEILQMYMLKPNFAMLDEIDSGLDVDSLKIVGENITEYKKKSKCGLIVITHYQRLLDYIKPEFVHIMLDGKIVQSGDASLVDYVEKNGYGEVKAKSDKKNNISGTCIMKDILNNE